MTAPTTVVRPTREHVEALAFAASDAGFSRALAAMLAPHPIHDDPKYLAAVADDQAARVALQAALDATFTELEQLRAEAGR